MRKKYHTLEELRAAKAESARKWRERHAYTAKMRARQGMALLRAYERGELVRAPVNNESSNVNNPSLGEKTAPGGGTAVMAPEQKGGQELRQFHSEKERRAAFEHLKKDIVVVRPTGIEVDFDE